MFYAPSHLFAKNSSPNCFLNAKTLSGFESSSTKKRDQQKCCSLFLAGVEGLEPSRTVLETGMLPLHHTPKQYVIHYQPHILYLSPVVLSRGYAKIIVKISVPYFKGTIGELSFCIQTVYLKSFFIKLKKNSKEAKNVSNPNRFSP